MGGVVKSTKGFLGLDSGPTVDVQNGNSALDQLNAQNKMYTNDNATSALSQYGLGNLSAQDAYSRGTAGVGAEQQQEFMNALATGATTGSKFATDQVNGNSILGGLYGSGPNSQLSQAEDRQNYLANNGYSLTKEDNDAMGQASGNIARQYGSQENSLAQALASHGLSAAPSGAAAVQFSGLAGNKNEALASMQTSIAQQRIQNNQNALAQNQSFLSSLGTGASNAINQQYDRQMQGANAQKSGLQNAASAQTQANQQANNANLNAAQFEQTNKPQNFMDMAQAGVSSAIGASGKSVGQGAGYSANNAMFGSDAAKAGTSGGAAKALV